MSIFEPFLISLMLFTIPNRILLDENVLYFVHLYEINFTAEFTALHFHNKYKYYFVLFS